jgi:hypothetical protein
MVFKLVARDDGNDELHGIYYGVGEDTITMEPSSDTWDLNFTANITGSISKIRFQAQADNEQFFIDEVRIGESWADVVTPDSGDSSIPEIPFERGLVLQVDADHVWAAYDANGVAKVFSTINIIKDDVTFNGKTPDQMPTVIPNALNGHAVLDFDGDNYLHCAARSYLDLPKMTTFLVLKTIDTSATQIIFRNGYDGYYDGTSTIKYDLWGVYTEGTNIIVHWRTNTGGLKATGAAFTPFVGQFGICYFSCDRDKVFFQINGGTVKSSSSGANAQACEHSRSRLGCNTVGANSGLNSFFTGQIAELLVYNRILTEDQKKVVGAYLADKYGLTTDYPSVVLDDCEDMWRNQKSHTVDFNQDCSVDTYDLNMLTDNWLEDELE